MQNRIAHHIAAAVTMLLTLSSCRHYSPERAWVESEGIRFPRCAPDSIVKATTRVSIDTTLPAGAVKVRAVNALSGEIVRQLWVNVDSTGALAAGLPYSDTAGVVRLRYKPRPRVVVAIRMIGWFPSSVAIDTRTGNEIQFALRSYCERQ